MMSRCGKAYSDADEYWKTKFAADLGTGKAAHFRLRGAQPPPPTNHLEYALLRRISLHCILNLKISSCFHISGSPYGTQARIRI
jgi:hypothetical protein